MKNSQLIYDALQACDVQMMLALPETWLVHLIRMAEEDPAVTLPRYRTIRNVVNSSCQSAKTEYLLDEIGRESIGQRDRSSTSGSENENRD